MPAEIIDQQALRRHYGKTTLAKMGIPFERGMGSKAVLIVVEGAARAEARRARQDVQMRDAA
jgi:hypothetical protein